MELKGVIEKIFDTQTVGSNNFQKREYVIETPDNYPQHIKFEMTQDRCKYLDNFRVGDAVVVSFDIRGREYNGKYFVNLQSWRIVKDHETATGGAADSAPADVNLGSGADDDLPF